MLAPGPLQASLHDTAQVPWVLAMQSHQHRCVHSAAQPPPLLPPHTLRESLVPSILPLQLHKQPHPRTRNSRSAVHALSHPSARPCKARTPPPPAHPERPHTAPRVRVKPSLPKDVAHIRHLLQHGERGQQPHQLLRAFVWCVVSSMCSGWSARVHHAHARARTTPMEWYGIYIPGPPCRQ